MDRFEELRRFVDKDALGLEVAPYFRPIAAKADGYNCLVLDVFDTEALRQNAEKDPNISSDTYDLIETVDIVSEASNLSKVIAEKNLVGQLKYIISSHNFEHLPDPISFLRGCAGALQPDGVLTMAVPDGRACFDLFRMPTRLSDWLFAYHNCHRQPTAEAIFDFQSNVAPPNTSRKASEPFCLQEDLKGAYDRYLDAQADPGPYLDTHCSVFFPQSLEVMLRDLQFLGLIDFEIIEISKTWGLEFFVHLRKVAPYAAGSNAADDAFFYAKRKELMQDMILSKASFAMKNVPERGPFKRFGRSILGADIMRRLSEVNEKRKSRRKTVHK